MLRSKTVGDINGRRIEEYIQLRRAVLARLNSENVLTPEERHKQSINSVFRKIAFTEIRQDLVLAREQGNAEEEKSVLARIGYLRDQHKNELRAAPQSAEVRKRAEVRSVLQEIASANPHLPIDLFSPKYAVGM